MKVKVFLQNGLKFGKDNAETCYLDRAMLANPMGKPQ